MRVLSTREEYFPRDLEGRRRVMSSALNNEFKIGFLLNTDSVPRDIFEIRERIRMEVGDDVHVPRNSVFRNYLYHNFIPAGLVAEDTVVSDNGQRKFLGYRLTESGKRFGVPLGFLSLNYATEMGISIFEFYGKNSSHGDMDAPLNRIKILEALQKGPLRRQDLVDLTGAVPRVVVSSLESLGELGFVQYESIRRKRGFSLYEWIVGTASSRARTVGYYAAATQDVAKELFRLRVASCHQIARSLKHYSDVIVSRILSGLEKQGFARSVKWTSDILSQAQLLDKGRECLEEYLSQFNALLTGRTMDMRDMQAHPQFGHILRSRILRYREVSAREQT